MMIGTMSKKSKAVAQTLERKESGFVWSTQSG